MEVIERKMLLIVLQKIFIGIKQSIDTQQYATYGKNFVTNLTIFSVTAFYLSV